MELAQMILLAWFVIEIGANLILAVAQGTGWQPKPRGKPNYPFGLLFFASLACVAYWAGAFSHIL